MSADATAWTFCHSPYRGATRLVHLAVADSVNDQHDNEFWMSQTNLALKAGVGRQTANTALSTMVTDGYLELLEEGGGRSRPSHYRFLFPAVPVLYDSRKLSSRATVSKLSSQRTVSPQTVVSASQTVVSGDRHRTQENPKEKTKATSTPALPTPKSPKARSATKPKAPPNPETAALVSHFVELADTPTLKRSRARIGSEIRKALDGGSAAADIRVALERVVREGNPGGFGRLLTGVERQSPHRLAPADSPLARGVLALAKAAKSGERWDGDEPQSLGDIAHRFDLGGTQ